MLIQLCVFVWYLPEFSQAFIDACEDAFVGCDKADGLTNKCRKLLRDLAREYVWLGWGESKILKYHVCCFDFLCVDTRYNDVEKLDRLAAVQAEVSEVQLVMQDNIDKVASWSGYPYHR